MQCHPKTTEYVFMQNVSPAKKEQSPSCLDCNQALRTDEGIGLYIFCIMNLIHEIQQSEGWCAML